jgi:hypothetical protein
VEAIRALTVAKRSARAERTQAVNQARALIVTGSDDLRARFAGHTAAALISGLASLRPRPGGTVGHATRIALRELGRRAEFLDGQIERLDELIVPLATARAPGLLALHGVGPDTAAMLLAAAGDHPERLRSEAAWAHLCAVAPMPEALRRPRGLPPPPRRRLAPKTPGTAWPAKRLPHPCWPSNDLPAVPGTAPACWPRDLIRACPPPRSGPSLSCPHQQTRQKHQPPRPPKTTSQANRNKP